MSHYRNQMESAGEGSATLDGLLEDLERLTDTVRSNNA